MGKFKYDIFLSYNTKDIRAVKILYNKLVKKFTVFLDREEIPVGGEIPTYLQNAILQSKYIVACFSANYFSSDWTKKELHTTLFRDPLNKRQKILPILLQKCIVPEFYSSYRYIDFTRKYQDGFELLCKTIKQDQRETSLQDTEFPEIVSGGSPIQIDDALIKRVSYTVKKANHLIKIKQSYSVVYMDIDNFTVINIVHGKDVGNAIINSLQRIKFANDIIMDYWRADEFTFLCKNYDAAQTQKICFDIGKQISSIDWDNISPGLYLTVSLGYAIAHERDSEYSDFFYTIERAIYGCIKAKRRGKGLFAPGPLYIKQEHHQHDVRKREESVQEKLYGLFSRHGS